jgi:hypothetical protein
LAYLASVRRATITIPEDLDAELTRYLSSQPAPPALATLVQATLRRFLAEEELRCRDFRLPPGPLRIRPAAEGSGPADVAERHDAYLAGADETE